MGEFLASDANEILGKLSRHAGDGHFADQRDAWLAQIQSLQTQLKGLEGWIFFEFNIPRMGRRVDVIIVLGSAIYALEFKVGETTYDRAAIEQVWDYALDLKNFHEASHNVAIIPILVATEAKPISAKFEADSDNVYRPILTNADNLRKTLESGLGIAKGSALDAQAWARASYKPTPTIIEAARALYAQHSVEAIARFDAGAQNLKITSRSEKEVHLLCDWRSRCWQNAGGIECSYTTTRRARSNSRCFPIG
jgi:hypothetical protein